MNNWIGRSVIIGMTPPASVFRGRTTTGWNLINHRLLKISVIAGAVLALFWGIYRRNARLIVTMLSIGIGPLVVGLLKATSAHSCPWDLLEYGGKAMSFPLFGTTPAFPGPGRCFPGGHASSGFAVMALFFLFIRNARAWLTGAGWAASRSACLWALARSCGAHVSFP